ncbi:MAG: hypothetical protein ACJAUB_001754 [Cryomorphaceae bacterium]|jgi:hypothetical protein
MIKENKVSKYFLYAIGEIVLVVIGILIALSINNSNQASSERKLESRYIFSLIEDAKTDLSNFNNAIIVNEERVNILDSLAVMCFNYTVKANKEPELFIQNQKAYTHPFFVTHTDRTLAQLKNTGSMRLITDKSIVDALIEYEGYFAKLTNQQEWYESALNNLIESGIPVFNFKYKSKNRQELDELSDKTGKLMTTNNQLIIELGNRALMYSSITQYYLFLLEEGSKRSLELIEILENDNSTNTVKE